MADILSDVCAEHAHGCRPADCSKPLCNGWQKEFANLRARRTLPRLARGEDICDGFQAPSQTCSLPYRLRRIESLHQRRRHVLARAEGLREGHLDRAPAGTRPHTGRSRRIHERSLIDAHSTLPLIMRDAHRHAPRAAPAPPVVARETEVVDPTVAAAFPLGAQAGGRGPNTSRI